MAEFNLERARKVLAPVYEDYLNGRKLYAGVRSEDHAPQRIFVPEHFKKGGRDHRVWLFFATMTDRREESMRVYESHREIAKNYPELYTNAVCKMSTSEVVATAVELSTLQVVDIIEEGEVEAILKKYKVGSPAQSANYWPRSAKTLFEDYAGDPLNIYKGRTINDIVATKNRSKKNGGDPLPGFGPKILSLLAIYLAELEVLAPIPDAFPVDVHVQRFCISTGILEGAGKVTNEEAERILRPGLCELCLEMGWAALDLSHAIWFLGNRLCTNCAKNSAVKFQCPAYENCGGAILTTTYFRKGYWLMDDARLRKGGNMQLRSFEDMPLFAQCL